MMEVIPFLFDRFQCSEKIAANNDEPLVVGSMIITALYQLKEGTKNNMS